MKRVKNPKNNSRRRFVKNVAIGIAGAALTSSLASGQSRASAGEKPKTDPGGISMTREKFLEYIDLFNRKDFEKVASYFSPDVILEYPDNFMRSQTPGTSPRTLNGPEEFIKNYQALTQNVREVINVGLFFSQGSHFCVELITEFHPLKSTEAGAQQKREVDIMNQCVIYDLDEKGKFKRIRIFHHRHLDPETAKQRIRG